MKCPDCGSDNTQRIDIEGDSEYQIVYSRACHACGFHWLEFFNIGVNEPDNDFPEGEFE